VTREINQAGIDLVKSFEGFFADAYICPAGVLTIGYGHTGDVVKDQCIDKSTAEALLRADLQSACASVERLVNVPLSDNQFAALASFAFNCGAGNLGMSTLLKKLNHGDYDAAPSELARWVKARDPSTDKKRTLRGLVRRRAAESELWLAPDGPAPAELDEHMPQQVELADTENHFRVTARSGLQMRGGPGLDFGIIETLPADTVVTVWPRQNEWAQVDLGGDGLIDGWVFSSYLEALS